MDLCSNLVYLGIKFGSIGHVLSAFIVDYFTERLYFCLVPFVVGF